MADCTYNDNPEITGRGVLSAFYLQGFLMVANGLLYIEKRDIIPSVITLFLICGTLLFAVYKEKSIYITLVLHHLLCFHVLCSHAVIVWVAENEHEETPRTNEGRRQRLSWRTCYRIAQGTGAVSLVFSLWFGFATKECDPKITVTYTNGLSLQWFAPLVLLPYGASVLVTFLLSSNCLKNGLPPSLVRTVVAVVWTSSLIFVIILLELTVSSDRKSMHNTSWSFGQVLPLALAVSPGALFVKHIITRFNINHFMKRSQPPPASVVHETSVNEGIELRDRLPMPRAVDVDEAVNVYTSSMLKNVHSVHISGGSFHQKMDMRISDEAEV